MTSTRKILALDLGQHCGWAAITESGQIVSGRCEFKPSRFESGGMIWIRFLAWLEETIKNLEPEIMVFEEVRGHRGVDAAHSYGGFLSHLMAVSELRKIPCQGVPVGTVKSAACGRGNASKTDVVKAMIAKGHNPMNEDEADALAILHWAISQYGSDPIQKQ